MNTRRDAITHQWHGRPGHERCALQFTRTQIATAPRSKKGSASSDPRIRINRIQMHLPTLDRPRPVKKPPLLAKSLPFPPHYPFPSTPHKRLPGTTISSTHSCLPVHDRDGRATCRQVQTS